MNYRQNLQAAITQAGGKTALARMLGTTHEAVHNWTVRAIPWNRAVQIEAVLGVKATDLAPSPVAALPPRRPAPALSPFGKAIEAAGGTKVKLADRLGVKPDTLEKWQTRGIPAERANQIENLFGIRAADLRKSMPS